VNIELLANIAEIFGALLVISGVFVSMIEIRRYRQQRQKKASLEIMRAFQNNDFTCATNTFATGFGPTT
jgi:hypothetical protein